MWEVAIDTGDVDSDSSKYIAIACNGVTRAKDDSAMHRTLHQNDVCQMTFPIR